MARGKIEPPTRVFFTLRDFNFYSLAIRSIILDFYSLVDIDRVSRHYDILDVNVSCRFPSTGFKSKHMGQCWGRNSAKDDINQIFIYPVLEDSLQGLDTLMHE